MGLVEAARAGDERAFVKLTSPQRASLHAHCYRLLGSLHDADDALQETMLRAWRGIDRFEPRAPVAAWLYRIATNVCLRMLEQRSRTPQPVDAHLEPYPELPLEDMQPSPDATAESREAIGLAFVATMQLLPPKQRVVLVLRDVLDWSAREVAEFFGDSVAAVNSALQRARQRVAQERDERSLARAHAPAGHAVEAALMRRFQDAWEAVDIEDLVALLADDALMTMPPVSARVAGAANIAEFFATQPLERTARPHPPPARPRQRPARARRLCGRPGQRALRPVRRDGPRGRGRPDYWDNRISGPTRSVRAARSSARSCTLIRRGWLTWMGFPSYVLGFVIHVLGTHPFLPL